MSHPCNYGYCYTLNSTYYQCNCPLGYYGDNCEIIGANVTCVDDPCLNNGTCLNSTATGYNCTCGDEYTGIQCEYALPPPCAEYYYGTNCSKFCQPQDSCLGHHLCDFVGDKVCMGDWFGPDCTLRTVVGLLDAECPGGAASACKSGGSCFNQSCCCTPGYTGPLCETDILECLSQPCQNGGTCLELVPGAYQCVCRLGFTGLNCDSFGNGRCASQPCKNGGTCTTLGSNYVCDCRSGYMGTQCEIDPTSSTAVIRDVTSTVTSAAHVKSLAATVTSQGALPVTTAQQRLSTSAAPTQQMTSVTTPVRAIVSTQMETTTTDAPVTCAPGYFGTSCSLTPGNATCADQPCYNGGVCSYHNETGVSCACVSGFNGTLCQKCAEGFYGDSCIPCVPTDSCDGHYTCDERTGRKLCLEGYMGPDCNRRNFSATLDPQCPNFQPCRNNGTCFNRMCCCLPGYKGIICQEEILECTSNPCQNGGICLDKINGYRCICPPDVNGTHCEFGGDEATESPQSSEGNLEMTSTLSSTATNNVITTAPDRPSTKVTKDSVTPSAKPVVISSIPDLLKTSVASALPTTKKISTTAKTEADPTSVATTRPTTITSPTTTLPTTTVTSPTTTLPTTTVTSPTTTLPTTTVTSPTATLPTTTVTSPTTTLPTTAVTSPTTTLPNTVTSPNTTLRTTPLLTTVTSMTTLPTTGTSPMTTLTMTVTSPTTTLPTTVTSPTTMLMPTVTSPTTTRSTTVTSPTTTLTTNVTSPTTTLPTTVTSPTTTLTTTVASPTTTRPTTVEASTAAETEAEPVRTSAVTSAILTTEKLSTVPEREADPTTTSEAITEKVTTTSEAEAESATTSMASDESKPTTDQPTSELPTDTDLSSASRLITTLSVSCPPGFTGTNCEVDLSSTSTVSVSGPTPTTTKALPPVTTATIPGPLATTGVTTPAPLPTTTKTVSLPPASLTTTIGGTGATENIIDTVTNVIGDLSQLTAAQLQQLLAAILQAYLAAQTGVSANLVAAGAANIGPGSPAFNGTFPPDARVRITNVRTKLAMGSDGQLYTRIYFNYEIVDAEGNVLSAGNDIPQEDLDRLINEMLGTGTGEELPKETPLEMINHFELLIKGYQLDNTLRPIVAQTLTALYQQQNPSFSSLINFRVVCPRSDEVVGDNREPATKFFYWLLHDDAAGSGSQIHPDDSVRPADSAILAELQNANLTWQMYAGQEKRSFVEAFSLFVEGKIYDADVSKFQTLLQTIWRTKQGYADVTVERLLRETYFSATGMEFTRLFYYVLKADGKLLTPVQIGITPPNENEVQQKITFSAASGEAYQLLVDNVNKTGDHTTLSSKLLLRARESFGLWATQRFLEENHIDFLTSIERQFKMVDEFQDAEILIIKQREHVSTQDQQIYSRLYFFLWSGGKIMDARRVETASPTVEALLSAVLDVTRPDGSTYTYHNLSAAMGAGVDIELDMCFMQVVKQAVVMQDYSKFSTSIYSALIEMDRALAITYDSVKVITTREYITKQGASVTVLLYTVALTTSGHTVYLDASTALQHQVAAQRLTDQLTFTQVNGEPYSIEEQTLLATAERADDMFGLFVESKVMAADYHAFQQALLVFLQPKIKTTVDDVVVLIQEEFKKVDGSSVWRLGCFIKAQDGSTTLPSAVMSFTEVQLVAAVKIRNARDMQYVLIVQRTAIDSLVRVSELYHLALTTVISHRDLVSFQLQLAQRYRQEIFELRLSTVTVTILSVDEYITEERETIYIVYHKLVSGSAMVSARHSVGLSSVALNSTVSGIPTPQRGAYSLVPVTALGQLVSAASLSSLTMNRAVLSTDLQAIQITLRLELTAVYKTKYTLTQFDEQTFSIVIVRQLEYLGSDGLTVWALQYLAVLQNESIYPSVLAYDALDYVTLSTKLPSSANQSYSILTAVDLSLYWRYSSCFRLVLQQEARRTEFAAMEQALVLVLKESVQEYSQMTIEVQILMVEQVIASTGQSYYQLVYAVSVDSRLLVSSVDYVVANQAVDAKIQSLSIVGARGVHKTVTLTQGLHVWRLARCQTLLAMGTVSVEDTVAFASVFRTVTRQISAVYANAEVTVVQAKLYFDITGTVHTEIRYIVSIRGKTVVPGTIPPLAIADITRQMALVSFVHRESFVVVRRASVTVYVADQLLTLYMTSAVLESNIRMLEQECAMVLSQRGEFSGRTVTIKLLKQEQRFSFTGEVAWAVHIAVFEDGTFVKALLVADLSFTERQAFLQRVTVTASTATYAAFIYQGSLTLSTSLTFLDLGTMTFRERVAESQFSAFAVSIKAALVATSSSYSSVSIEVIRQEAYVQPDGELVWCLFYAMRSSASAQLLRRVDVRSISAQVMATSISGIATVKGPAFTLISDSAAIQKLVRKLHLFQGIVLSDRVRVADKEALEVELADVYLARLRVVYGSTFSANVKVILLRQEEWVSSMRQTSFALFCAVYVDGVLISAQTSSAFAAVAAELQLIVQGLQSVVIRGTQLTYSEVFLQSSVVLGEWRQYQTFFSLNLKALVKTSVYAELEALIAAEVRAQLGLSMSASIAVKILKQEWVDVSVGLTCNRLSYSITVDGKRLDFRSTASLNRDAIIASVKASAISQHISFFSGVSQSQLAVGLRQQDAQSLCVRNYISGADISTLQQVIRQTYLQMEPSWTTTLTLRTARVETQIQVQTGVKVYCYKFYPEVSGVAVSRTLELSTLRSALQRYSSAAGQAYALVVRSSSSLLLPERYGFSLYLRLKARHVDRSAIVAALRAAWSTYRPDLQSVEVTAIEQEETYNEHGEMVIRFVYFVRSTQMSLNGEIESSVASSDLVTALTPVPVSGHPQPGSDYGRHVYQGDWNLLVRKKDLCFIVLQQKVAEEHFASFEQALTQSWIQVDPSVAGISISIVTQEEVIVRQRYAAFQLYYKAASSDGLLTCRNFDDTLISAIKAKVTFPTLGGDLYTIWKVATMDIVEKSYAFSFWLDIKVGYEDVVNVVASLATRWKAEFGVDVSIEIGLQEEYINMQGKTVWKVLYVVKQAGSTLDAQVDEGLSMAQILNALFSVTVSAGSVASTSYSIHVITTSTLGFVHYEKRFGVNMVAEVKRTDFAAIETALLQIWQQEKPEYTDVSVTIAQQEEVIDKTGATAFQLVYFASVGGKVLDARVIQAIDVSVLHSKLQQAAIQGPRGAYAVLTGLQRPLLRSTQSHAIYVDGFVQAQDNQKFTQALRTRWTTVFADAVIIFAKQEEYVLDKRFATAIVYFLYANGAIIEPGTVEKLDLVALQQEIDFKNKDNVAYSLVVSDTPALYRYRYHFSAHLSRAIKTTQLTQILANLQSQWLQTVFLFNRVTIEGGIQEEMVDLQGSTFWKVSYFLMVDDSLVNAHLVVELLEVNLRAAFAVTVPGSASTYSSHLVLDTSLISTLTRLTELFTVTFTQKAAVVKYTALAAAFKQAWIRMGSEYSAVSITIRKQERYISDLGEFIWRLFYHVERSGEVLKSIEFASPSFSQLDQSVAVTSPRGYKYQVYDASQRRSYRYSSAFSHLLMRPVLTVDQAPVKQSILATWKLVRTDLASTLAIFTGSQEEYLDENGKSVYKYLYFLTAGSSSQLVNALFEATLDSAREQDALDVAQSQTAVKYSAHLFTGDGSRLVSYWYLVDVPMETVVEQEDFELIENILEDAWESTSSEYQSIIIKIRAQEDYLDTEGAYVSMLLYSATLSGLSLSVEDLPALDRAKLAPIEALRGASGAYYKLSTKPSNQLLRYKAAMSSFLDQWVTRKDVSGILSAAEQVMKQLNTGYDSLSVQLGTQERFVDASGKVVYKFVLFAYLGTRLLDSSYEIPLQSPALQAKLASAALTRSYTALEDAQASGSRNLRHSFTLYVNGLVARQDFSAFAIKLQQLWQTREAGVTVDIPLQEEFIGEQSISVGGLTYFLTRGAATVNPGEVVPPSQPDFLGSIVVPSFRGPLYELYLGRRQRYDAQYSVAVTGELYADQARQVVAAIHSTWLTMVGGGANIELTFTKQEPAVGELGAEVTQVLYSASLEQKATFPANDPPPAADTVQSTVHSALAFVNPYKGTQPVRTAHLFSVLVEGEILKAKKKQLETGLGSAWKLVSGVSAPVCSVMGRHRRVGITAGTAVVSQVYYTVRSSGGLLSVTDSVQPDLGMLQARVSSAIRQQVYTQASLSLRTLLFNTNIAALAQTDNATAAIQTAWTLAQPSQTDMSVKLTPKLQQTFSRDSWSRTYRSFYSVSTGGADPVEFRGRAPESSSLQTYLSAAGLGLCQCRAKRNFRLYFRNIESEVTQKSTQLPLAIKKAWYSVNTDFLLDDFKVRHSVNQPRRSKRSPVTNATLSDEDGEPLSPVDYHVDVRDQEPHPLFVNEPSDDILSPFLEDIDLDLCGSACTPRKCYSVLLEGATDASEKAKLEDTLKEAFLAANPGLDADGIEVHITQIDSGKQDALGNQVTEVLYCVSRVDGGDVADLSPPSPPQLDDALQKAGKTRVPIDSNITDAGSPLESQWIIAVIVICAVAAFILVMLAVCKVILRRRQWKKEDEIQKQRQLEFIDDEQYAGHGQFQAAIFGKSAITIGSKMHMNDSLRSDHKLINN